MPRVAPLVFISSTDEDLADYRSAIQRSLPCLDVLYRGMEYFFSRPNRPWDVVQEELLESDIVILILANRYGELLPDNSMSYTEAEYRRAQEWHKPILPFVIDPDHSVRPGAVERGDAAKRLEELKRQVQHETTAAKPFTTPDDLVYKLHHSLAGWLKEEQRQLSDRLYHGPDDRESDYIRALYTADTRTVAEAVDRLSRPDCRAAQEHFFARLHDPALPRTIAEAMLRHFRYSHDRKRTSQILRALLNDTMPLRPYVIFIIGERAQLETGSVTEHDFNAVANLSNSDDANTRAEVAHAIGKMGRIGVQWYDRATQILERLSSDPDDLVRRKATLAIDRMPQRWSIGGHSH